MTAITATTTSHSTPVSMVSIDRLSLDDILSDLELFSNPRNDSDLHPLLQLGQTVFPSSSSSSSSSKRISSETVSRTDTKLLLSNDSNHSLSKHDYLHLSRSFIKTGQDALRLNTELVDETMFGLELGNNKSFESKQTRVDLLHSKAAQLQTRAEKWQDGFESALHQMDDVHHPTIATATETSTASLEAATPTLPSSQSMVANEKASERDHTDSSSVVANLFGSEVLIPDSSSYPSIPVIHQQHRGNMETAEKGEETPSNGHHLDRSPSSGNQTHPTPSVSLASTITISSGGDISQDSVAADIQHNDDDDDPWDLS